MKSTELRSNKLFSSEDYWAIWVGGFLLFAGILVFFIHSGKELSTNRKAASRALIKMEASAPIKTVEWYDLYEEKRNMSGSKTDPGRWLSGLTANVKTWNWNPLTAFVRSKAEAQEVYGLMSVELNKKKLNVDNLRSAALQYQSDAGKANWQDEHLNISANAAIVKWNDALEDYKAFMKRADARPYNVIVNLIVLGLFLSLLFGLGAHFMGSDYLKFIFGFWGIYLIAIFSYLIAAQSDMKNIGFGYAVWAILFGMIISNTVGVPKWLEEGVKTEYYIKTGLVLLGAEILFGKIMTIGLPGLFVAWIVTPIVLVLTYWFGQRVLKISSKTLNITISADMSVCGVSAAIATAAACNAKKEELTLAVGLSMVFTSVMMIALPALIKAMGMPEVLGGAWIGGTIDATGAVVAAGAFLGDTALNVAATIKMIQNILIGVIAFCVALYWALKVEKTGNAQVGISEVWKRFPKFILGFLGASILFSSMYFVMGKDLGDALIDQGVIRSFSKNLRSWFFCLAFVSIGLSTNFKVLRHHFKGGKPLILYVTGQAFNLLLTLLMAYLMFYLVFPEITERI